MNPRIVVASLSLSAVGLLGIALHEGFRDTAYDDGVGVATVGFGSTAGVKLGDKITVQRGLVKLAGDVSAHETGLRKCIGDTPLYQREWDAYVSWAFNVGVGAACGSTLVRKLKTYDYAGACAELLKWDKAGGKVLRGLTVRRQSEYKTCMGPQ